MLLVLSVTVLSGIALCVLAWRLSVLDQALARQRDRERLEHAADSGSGALLQRVTETGDRFRALLDSDPARNPRSLEALADRCRSCKTILLEPGLVTLFPAISLRYDPEPPSPPVIDNNVFGDGETLEFTRRDYQAAARWFVDLADRSKDAVRAGALIGAARNFTKQKDFGRALAAWSNVEQLGAVPANGEPCALVARFARLPLLGEQSRQTEARQPINDLESGRWRLSRTSDEYFSGELSKLTGIKPAPPAWEEAVYSIAQFARTEHIASGERVLQGTSSTPVLAIWRTHRETTAAIAPPIGMFAELDSLDVKVRLEAGEWLVVTSDGIPEATRENGEEFGDMRLLATLDRSGTTDNLCRATLDAATSFAGKKQADDLTIVAARIDRAPAANVR